MRKPKYANRILAALVMEVKYSRPKGARKGTWGAALLWLRESGYITNDPRTGCYVATEKGVNHACAAGWTERMTGSLRFCDKGRALLGWKTDQPSVHRWLLENAPAPPALLSEG